MADEVDVSAQTFGVLAGYLKGIGLDKLFKLDKDGNPSGWLWNRIQAGADETQLRTELEQTDVFRQRFGVIGEQQARAAKGLPTYVMSPAEVIQWEDEVKKIFVSAGLPSTFYDEPSDFHAMILKGFSPAEVADRVDEAVGFVQSAPREVRKAFEDYYGVGHGDAALATWALDPDRTVRDVQRAQRTAYAGGMAKRFDIEMDKKGAQRIAALDMSPAEVQSKYRQVNEMDALFTESLGEANDITQKQGVAAVFEGKANAVKRINRRVATRSAINRSPAGGGAITQAGFVGAGSSG
jgi:hypothetical protein